MARGEGKRSWLQVALIIGVVLTLVGLRSASADPLIDGLFDPNEGYAIGWNADLEVEGKGKNGSTTLVPGGEVWIHEDSSTGNVSVLFSQPLTLIDTMTTKIANRRYMVDAPLVGTAPYKDKTTSPTMRPRPLGLHRVARPEASDTNTSPARCNFLPKGRGCGARHRLIQLCRMAATAGSDVGEGV